MSYLLLIHGAWELDEIVESLNRGGHDARAIDPLPELEWLACR
ncbi:hypothetical protein OAX78_00085 [Planctomycetota bacterium]|nr:hypothetical protein [Planctomycetota bacterium]